MNDSLNLLKATLTLQVGVAPLIEKYYTMLYTNKNNTNLQLLGLLHLRHNRFSISLLWSQSARGRCQNLFMNTVRK